ncbi:transposase [Streptomyces sp. NPDC051577]|uniref:transposase n=1 Tax=Streptomyces sp. NPDC051577 TaxID=3155166 RepID=UPI003433B527
MVATRLRKGSAGSGKGAASLLREALATVRAMGITAQIVVRADSAYFSHKVVDACRKAGVRFSPGRRGHQDHPQRHRDDRPRHLDSDRVHRRGLGRGGATLDLRRRDRRSPLHGVHQQEEGVPHHRPAHRAPRETAQPEDGARGAE